jgi:hypothetical protein
VPLTGPSAIGNEPHHVGLSADGKTLALGGLLSVLRGQDQVFFFDVSRLRDPVFLSSNNPPKASIADEFDSLKKGGFLATFMGSPDGANPGRVVEYDSNQRFVQAWPQVPPTDGFDPHGISIDEAHNLIVTSDFVCPLPRSMLLAEAKSFCTAETFLPARMGYLVTGPAMVLLALMAVAVVVAARMTQGKDQYPLSPAERYRGAGGTDQREPYRRVPRQAKSRAGIGQGISRMFPVRVGFPDSIRSIG